MKKTYSQTTTFSFIFTFSLLLHSLYNMCLLSSSWKYKKTPEENTCAEGKQTRGMKERLPLSLRLHPLQNIESPRSQIHHTHSHVTSTRQTSDARPITARALIQSRGCLFFGPARRHNPAHPVRPAHQQRASGGEIKKIRGEVANGGEYNFVCFISCTTRQRLKWCHLLLGLLAMLLDCRDVGAMMIGGGKW